MASIDRFVRLANVFGSAIAAVYPPPLELESMKDVGKFSEASAGHRFGVLIFPNFPMMAFSAVIEPLRAANIVAGRQIYEWMIVASGAGTVLASNGIAIAPDYIVDEAPAANYIVVCSGGDADRLKYQRPLMWIRRNLREGGNIGSVADGAFYLARAGLLDDYACTLHWRSQPAFVEAFPSIALKRQLYVIDRNRFTSAGGIGALDMMLDIIASHHGDSLSRQVAEWFVHDRIRADADREKLQLRLRTGIRNDIVLGAVERMELTIESHETLRDTARALGVSMAKLERSFSVELGMSPAQYYRHLRLVRARDLLEHSSMSVREIGLACGYASFSAFVRAFRKAHGETPRKMRR